MSSSPALENPLAQQYALPKWPRFENDEIEAAKAVLESGKVNYWTGNEGKTFEKEYAEYFGVKHAIAMGNGSLAIEDALHALNLKPGDEVIVTPRTFLASASSAIIRGLIPKFADVDRDSGNITAETIERVITKKTKAIIPVHLGGWPCEMEPIMALANSKGIKVLEDCAQSHLATIDGRFAGTYGQINAWSFCQDKIITTGGEGGMVTTDDEDLWNRAWSYKDHGKSYDAMFNRKYPPGFRWQHESFGTNMRLTEPQSAIGRIQLCKVKNWVEQRRRNARVVTERISGLPGIRVPHPREGIVGSYYRLYAYLDPAALKSGVSREDLISEVTAAGVPLFSGSCSEIYLEKAFDGTGFRPAQRLPVAKELGETSLCFLTHPTLTEEHMHMVADVFVSAFEKLKR